MRPLINSLGLIGTLSAAVAWGCGPEFETCHAKRSCPTGGGGGEAGANGSEHGGTGGKEVGGGNGAANAAGDGGLGGSGGTTLGEAGSAGRGEGGNGAAGAVGEGGAIGEGGGSEQGGSGGEGGGGSEQGGSGGEGGARPDPCESSSCENGGVCRSEEGEARCKCTPGFTGARCELPRIEWIPRLEGDKLSYAYATNSDGSVVVGTTSASNYRAFRWEKGLVEDLGQLPGFSLMIAESVNSDGSIVVGTGTGATDSRGFRWEAGFLKPLPPLPGETSSSAEAISADGTTIVGKSGLRTVRWRGSSIEDLGPLGLPTGISADGSVIVGDNDQTAFRWEAGASMNIIPVTSGTTCRAGAVSGDSLVIVGSCETGSEWRSYAWTAAGLKDLGLPPLGKYPPRVVISGTNRNGTEAVGYAATADRDRAVLWDSKNGMRWVDAILSEAGVDLGGQELRYATGVSDDGKTVVGWGYPIVGDFQGWVVRLP